MEENMEISAMEEISTCGTSGEDKDDSSDDGDDNGAITASGGDGDEATRSALHNSIVLQHIFSNLGFHELKVVRTICKAWEDEGSIRLGKLCRLPIDPLFDYYEGYQEEPLPVNPKLLQCIYIPSSVFAINSYAKGLLPDNVAITCFNSFASMWHHVVVELEVSMDMYFTVGLHSTLTTHAFPNLAKITIIKDLSNGITTNPNLQFGCMNALKELKFVDCDLLVSDGYSLLQNLISSSPNLEVLDIYGHFYPILASCRKLKVLKWIKGRGQLLMPDEVIRMINEVGNELEHLTIGLRSHLRITDSPVNILNQQFPKLPKVKSLSLEKTDFLNVVERISPQLLPNLQMLSYPHVNNVVDASGVELDCYSTHKGVNSLELSVVGGPDPITMASKRFPNVKRLMIRIEDPNGTEGVAGIPYLGTVLLSVLEASSIWKLIYLEVQIGKKCNLSQLLGELKSLSLMDDGIKKVGITLLPNIALSSYLVDDDQDYDLQALKDVLQLGAKFDRMILKGFGAALKPTTMEKVLDFLNENKQLPVFYVD